MSNQPADKPPLSAANPGANFTSLREVKAAGGRWGLDEFVEVVNSLVERYLPASRSYNIKLRDAFNPRLVRYYATFGLISPPEREGKEARYHYGHLLQALVIRRLLFEGYTAPALLKMLAGKTEADYEAMLAGGVSTAAAAVSREEVDGHIAAGPPEHLRLVRDLMAAAPPVPPPIPSSPPPIPLAPMLDKPPPIPAAALATGVRAESTLWRRIEVAPGFELHVRADFVVPDTRAERESLLLAVLEGLQPGRRK